eukprot:g13422.t1
MYDQGHIYDTCRRIFNVQVGHLFGKPWSECFLSELPQQAGGELKARVLRKEDGHRYPCRPHFFLQVTEDFYETTRCYEDRSADASGVIKLPQPQGDFVKWDDLASARRVHLEGTCWMEHDEEWMEFYGPLGAADVFSWFPMAKPMSLLAAAGAGAYLCSEAFVPGTGVARAQAPTSQLRTAHSSLSSSAVLGVAAAGALAAAGGVAVVPRTRKAAVVCKSFENELGATLPFKHLGCTFPRWPKG